MNVKSDFVSLTREQRVAIRTHFGLQLTGDHDPVLFDAEKLAKLGKGTYEEARSKVVVSEPVAKGKKK